MTLIVLLVLSILTSSLAIETTTSKAKCGQSPSYGRFSQLYDEQEGGFHHRIVSGDVAAEGDWPWATAVEAREMYPNGTLTQRKMMCTAAVIHKDWILTAAHCVNDGFHIHRIMIGVGSKNIEKQTTYGIDGLYIHPKYQFTMQFENDIALLKLNESLEFYEHVQPICLSRSIKVQENEILAAAGWGRTFDYMAKVVSAGTSMFAKNEGAVLAGSPQDLQERPVAVRNTSYCSLIQEQNDTEYICVGGLNNGVMAGDSGGALMARRNGTWYHVGNAHSSRIVATETRIDLEAQSLYAETSQFCDFIEKMTSGDVVCEE